MSGKELAGLTLTYVNCYGCDNKEFARAIANAHRSLQQAVMRLIVATVHELAQTSTDARNEHAVALAKEMDQIAGKYSLPWI